ncbi:histidine phosphatase family protein [Arthrobacter flavus]|uniref:Histidine phosphatase family protein n=1 Tax=Arthrobacter flavus TaxID=95172 RepID=A0ABW4Q978_9MICC
MKEIFVVTHPEATHHIENRVGGWFDSRLTERGRDQAEQIAQALSNLVDTGVALYTSDLRRARETAAIVGSVLGLAPQELTALREKSYGEGEGMPDALFRERFIPPPLNGERMDHDEGLAGAETKAHWASRVFSGMDTIMRDPAPQKVIVTHGGSATLAIAHWIGMPLDSLDTVSFRLDSGSITHLREDDYFHNHAVVTLNETSHLSA